MDGEVPVKIRILENATTSRQFAHLYTSIPEDKAFCAIMHVEVTTIPYLSLKESKERVLDVVCCPSQNIKSLGEGSER